MRVTNKTINQSFLRNLEYVASEKVKNEVRISTGKDLYNIADAPDRLVDTKLTEQRIAENKTYITITDDAVNEMQETHDKMNNLSEQIDEIRQLLIDSTSTGNSGNIFTLGVYVKGLLDDMLSNVNIDFKGKYLFAGTKTRPYAIEASGKGSNGMPYEVITNEATPENPSGMKVVYKGNDEKRIINRDRRSTEQINIIPSEAFGANGEELFNTVIEIYNLMAFDKEGNPRRRGDVFDKDDIAHVDVLHEKMSAFQENVDQNTSRLAATLLRLQTINQQMVSENSNLKDFRSKKADTDVAARSIDLKGFDNALNYSLKIGGAIQKLTLFDFI